VSLKSLSDALPDLKGKEQAPNVEGETRGQNESQRDEKSENFQRRSNPRNNNQNRNRGRGMKKSYPSNHIGQSRGSANTTQELQPFDFEKSNSLFEKEKIRDEVVKEASEGVVSSNIGTYKKDNFFDTISCETLEKQTETETTMPFDEQRKRDMETFGASSVHDQHRRGRGRRYHTYTSYRGGGYNRGGYHRGGGRYNPNKPNQNRTTDNNS
jgi:signal recognition particle GTPase